MNKMERMRAVLAGQSVDRPPVCFWHHFGNIGPKATVDAHLRFYRETNADILKMMCDEFFIYPLGDARTPEEFLRLKPQGRQSAYVRGQVERASQINEALKGECMSLYNAFSPYATLKHAIGDEASMALLREHEDAAMHLMDIICEDTCYLIEGVLKESGTTGMMIPLQGAEEGRFTAEEYARLVAPTEKTIIDCAQQLSDANLLHFCGWDGAPNHLEWWDQYPAPMVNWAVYVENIDLAAGRSRFPGRVLMGSFDNRPQGVLYSGTKEAIQAETRRIVREAGKDGIILGADCSLPQDIDHQRIRWITEALDNL